MKTRISLAVALVGLVCAFGLAHAEPESPDSIVRVGACATPGITWAVFVQDSFAHVADRDRLTVVDISVPSTPTVAGTLSQTGTVWPVALSVRDTLAYLHNDGIFSVVCVSDPSSLYVVGWCFTSSGVGLEPKGICFKENLVYLTEGSEGFDIANAVDPSLPELISSCQTPGTGVDLFVKDTLAYIADYDSLQIFSVADSTNAYRVGAVAMPQSCYDVFVIDTIACVACESSVGTDGTLQVVNVSDPGTPLVVASVAMNGDPLGVYISSDYAYVAAADWWSSDKGPRQVGGLRPLWAEDLVADVEGGLRVVNISDPSSPTLVASYDTPGDPRDVFVRDTLAFVADYDSLQILGHITVGVEEEVVRGLNITGLHLRQNQPNPFCTVTSIQYSVMRPGHVALRVYDVTGRLVKTLVDEEQNVGDYCVKWHGSRVASGIYFCCLRSGTRRLSLRMVKVQ